MQVGDILYRIFDRACSSRVTLHFVEYGVTKLTPHGAWIEATDIMSLVYMKNPKRWINTTAFRRFAWPTKHEALQSFVRRKKCQQAILKAKLERANEAEQKALKLLRDVETTARILT